MTPECERLGLQAVLVEDDHAVDVLRSIRNACKDGFAHDNEPITVLAQRAWWVANRGRIKAWLYWRESDGIVGYGLVRQTDDGRWWSSVAVLPVHAGHGYGGAITADLVRRMCVPVWGQARLDQPAAMRLHRAADWEQVERDEWLATYRTRVHVYDLQFADWAAHGLAVA